MTLDYGFQPTRRGRLAERATCLGVAAMLVAVLPLTLISQRQSAVGRVDAWLAPGSPCPVITQAAYVAFGTPIKDRFDFEGARFGRAYGNASCARIPADRVLGLGHTPVCQFDGPTIVEVATRDDQVFFMAGMQPVTITLPGGRPRCVLGAKLGPDWRRN